MSGYAADDHDTAVSALPSDVLLMFGARHKPCERCDGQDEQCIILGQFPRVVYGTVEDPSMRAHLHRLLNLGEPCGGETSIRRCDGSISYIEWHISPIRVQDEQVTHFISLQRDVTASKRTEMLSGDQRAVLEATISGEPLLTVFDRLMQLLERQRPHMQAAFWALHDGRLINRAARGLSDEYILAVQNYAVNNVAHTPCGAAVQQGQSITVSDSADDERWPAWCEIARTHNVSACWTIPVIAGSGTVLGVLALYATQPLHPTTNDLLLLDTTSQLMALALEQRQLNDQIVYHTSHDTLTHLPNRTGFIEQVQQALHQAQEHDNLVAICFIDLDRFKQINDTLGHAVGDEILSQTAARFSEAVQAPDTLARIGDDTFALLLTHPRTIQDAMRSAQHLQTMLIMPFDIGARELFITASIGISIYPQDGTDTHTLLRNADNAMHRAKTSGFNTVMCFTPQMTSLAVERLDLEHQLRLALERGDLRLHYQPQIDVTSGRIIGVEALMRWQHPERGMVSPGQFIPLAEESGLIVPIGFWALTEACRQAVAWQQAGMPPIRVAVNVSAVQLAQEDFVDHVQTALLQSGLHPNLLELEMTESVLMSDREAHGQRLKELRAMGVRVSIDDFGTGYSSLAYLHHFPVDGLKIDQSFVRIIDTETTGMTDPRALVQGIATLARSFRLRVIAEGVENREQLDFLSQIDCDEAQGFLFAPALPAAELHALLSAQEQETPHALPWADAFAAWQPE
jgi:diguanylate cyclase (GGDEF)-like protein